MTQTDAKVRNSKRAVDEAQAWRHGPRRYFPIEQKLAIVAECSVAGATLSSVALKHGLNANMVRKWVVRHRAGTLAAGSVPRPSMIPVVIPAAGQATLGERDASPREVRVEIETPRGVMRVSGCVDEPILSALIFSMPRG
ncbi:MAG: IS66-like element accessory protein TnpA [Burkholderiales bacterium]|jgi:transposase-like protein|nr:transposase [Novosphingobium sp.]